MKYCDSFQQTISTALYDETTFCEEVFEENETYQGGPTGGGEEEREEEAYQGEHDYNYLYFEKGWVSDNLYRALQRVFDESRTFSKQFFARLQKSV